MGNAAENVRAYVTGVAPEKPNDEPQGASQAVLAYLGGAGMMHGGKVLGRQIPEGAPRHHISAADIPDFLRDPYQEEVTLQQTNQQQGEQ